MTRRDRTDCVPAPPRVFSLAQAWTSRNRSALPWRDGKPASSAFYEGGPSPRWTTRTLLYRVKSSLMPGRSWKN